MIANILSIAGSDPSGGAGIQADIKAISANGGYAMAAITALTAQNTTGVQGFTPVDPFMVRDQIAAIAADIRIDAIKIGMLGNAGIIEVVADALERIEAPVVLDPVMVAKGGDRLLAADAVAVLRERILPRARVVTPNLPEAGDLLGEPEARDLNAMRAQGERLLALGSKAVLMKGGHLPGGEATDLLVTPGGETVLSAARIATKNTHGTGCTLSSALATQLGLGLDLTQAVRRAKAYIGGAIAAADALQVGHGHGPVHHFFDHQTSSTTTGAC
ncbi:bifunctional hydroxymethylpyrimidine kinase/phosphomethylpyrimidine kinase [Fulvimarina sp. 2208YS6-2-32]|uniref:hydroxymethylpyrimidine kinase n=1 Tax=Fulvimarina uroteuthidis TaxID=3098149 RepID=A0ABU5HZZ4_9HYPH|nr:bifunctional hydroxymethylpyrimidine kinase/phosphomethylpyrimidine kinase [Fulvimarina sp. 2208YS6-2-32]MDY8108635.1 bifunctional hydroxymethylpyrimidine kinase/phosphomethylpyrimidine kinase [Fulvimarina sp. 2208YS6-2-32]